MHGMATVNCRGCRF